MMHPNFIERHEAPRRHLPLLSAMTVLVVTGFAFVAADHWSGLGLVTAFRAAATGCRIKGNIGSDPADRRFFPPEHPRYAMIRIDAGHGERWFCTAAQARAAGWRPAG
ncbi:succinoglycan biosynthesis protein exoi [Rhizobium sp. TRM95111]|uniref:sunset domain-containing protein n=1 Tax=Rhizobium alarense TaxID=2846851 RepID=UPI001F3014E8|nr:succinoglycan biosynthesis protein exoi [Rhizobium alarense]MCF3638484.1 succinoglycan biosynthesis protein exoi [Rhizobium alarense]